MEKKLSILFIEDTPCDVELAVQQIEAVGYRVKWRRVETAADLQEALAHDEWDVVLSDYLMPGLLGTEALAMVRQDGRGLPFIFVSGAIGEDVAVQAMKAGAQDYLLKGNLKRLVPAIERELRESGERVQRKRVEAALRESEVRFDSLLKLAPVPMGLANREGVLTFLNDRFTQIFGYTLEDIPTLNAWWERAYPDAAYRRQVWADWNSVLSNSAQGATGGEPIECTVTCKDGTTRVVLVSGMAVGEGQLACFMDLTVRKRAEESLRHQLELRNQLAHIAATVPGMIYSFRLRPDGTVCFPYVSPALDDIFGLKPESVQADASPAFAMIHPKDLSRVRASIAESARSGTPWRQEFRLRGTRRGDIWVEGHSVPQSEPDGSVLWHGFLHDVTARKRSEAQLRQLSRAVEQSPVSVVITNTSGAIEYVNPKFAELTGYTRDEVLGKNPRILKSGALSAEVYRELWRTLLSGREWRGEFHNRKKNGDLFWEQASISPLVDDAGQIAHYVAVKEDITERKRAESELRESKRLLEKAQQVGGIGSWVSDPGPMGKLVWSEETCRIFGFAPGEFDENLATFFSLIHPDDLESVKRAAQSALQDGKPYEVDHRIVRKDGSTRWVHEFADVERDAAGLPVRMIGVVQDITERKQLETNFLRAQRLEAVGALASGLAHDLNNILAPILMTAPLLRNSASDWDSLAMLDTIESCARRGADIIRQLLTFARGSEGERIPLPVRHLLRDLEKIIRETFPADIRPHLETPKGLWLMLGNATQIHQALMNLCVNARDAMPDGGRLTMIAENVAVDAAFAAGVPDAKVGPYVCVSVTDTGTGIPPENLNRIFDPFFSTKEIGKGTGLGLATVLGIVRGHGGFMQVSSQLRQGTRFELYFPAAPEAQMTPPALSETGPLHGRGELILVVEDEEPVRDALQRTLELHGYRVVTARNGAEGLAVFSRHRDEIRAILTDMMMPVMKGPDMIHTLRALDSHPPLLGMSGQLELQEIKGLELDSLAAFLTKPFPGSEMLRVLQNVLNRPQSDPHPPNTP